MCELTVEFAVFRLKYLVIGAYSECDKDKSQCYKSKYPSRQYVISIDWSSGRFFH